MICKKCSAEYNDEYAFCPECGERLPLNNAATSTDLFSDDWMKDIVNDTNVEVQQKKEYIGVASPDTVPKNWL